jgi:transposase-like protein
MNVRSTRRLRTFASDLTGQTIRPGVERAGSPGQWLLAPDLQRVLGLGSCKTAWTWLHKLRRATGRLERDRLAERVEVDETYLGGSEAGVRGRQTERKTLIIIAAQEDGPGIGRIRTRRIVDASAESLVPFIRDSVEAGSVVHTNGWLGYEPLGREGYDHHVTFLKGTSRPHRN